MTPMQLGECEVIFQQDRKANTFSVWLVLEPHVAARFKVGFTIRALSERGVWYRWRVVGIDEVRSRVYVVPQSGTLEN